MKPEFTSLFNSLKWPSLGRLLIHQSLKDPNRIGLKISYTISTCLQKVIGSFSQGSSFFPPPHARVFVSTTEFRIDPEFSTHLFFVMLSTKCVCFVVVDVFRYSSASWKANDRESWSGRETNNMSTASNHCRWTGGANRYTVGRETKGE